MIEWSPAYSVNNAEIDGQHQELMSLLNDLEKAMKEGQGKQALDQVFTRLIVYTQEHFAAEEKLMWQHGYPEAASHQARHVDLTRQVISLQQRYALNKTGLTVETARFLSDWLSYHILGQDKKFGLFLKTKGLA